MKHFKDKVERRVQEDRRKKRFGRRGPKWVLSIANWLTTNPNVFYIYMLISMIALLYTFANLAYNIDQFILAFFKDMVK
jgi:hypothetical protein